MLRAKEMRNVYNNLAPRRRPSTRRRNHRVMRPTCVGTIGMASTAGVLEDLAGGWIVSLPTLRQLEYLVAVADHRHFGQAARHCAVSQPALSKQVREVESLLGIDIFERSRPQILITRPGEMIVEQARRVLAEARALTRLAANAQGDVSGPLHCGVIPTLAPYVLPPLLQALQERFPRLKPLLYEAQTDDLVEALRAGELDVVLMAWPVSHDGLDGGPIFSEPFVVAAPTDHPLAQPAAIQHEALRHHALLLMDEGHCFRDHALDVCASVEAQEDMAVRASSLTTLALMVHHGIGATLIPAMALPVEFATRRNVVLRAFATHPPKRQVGLAWRRRSVRVELFETMVALLRRFALAFNLPSMPELFGPTPKISLVDTDEDVA